MRYRSVYTVTFDAPSDADAISIATQHYHQIHDVLRVEGADHPHDITLAHMYSDGRADILEDQRPSDELTSIREGSRAGRSARHRRG
jgi:hypothetical protein